MMHQETWQGRGLRSPRNLPTLEASGEDTPELGSWNRLIRCCMPIPLTLTMQDKVPFQRVVLIDRSPLPRHTGALQSPALQFHAGRGEWSSRMLPPPRSSGPGSRQIDRKLTRLSVRDAVALPEGG